MQCRQINGAHGATSARLRSQLADVRANSTLPPESTVLGTVDEPSLAVLDQFAAAGNDGANRPGDRAPNQPVDIESARVPS